MDWAPEEECGYEETVALAIPAIVFWANRLGSPLPLVTARQCVDPAIVPGLVMSTLVDATDSFIYFSLVRILLGL